MCMYFSPLSFQVFCLSDCICHIKFTSLLNNGLGKAHENLFIGWPKLIIQFGYKCDNTICMLLKLQRFKNDDTSTLRHIDETELTRTRIIYFYSLLFSFDILKRTG